MTEALAWTRARPLGAFFAATLSAAVLARYGLGAPGLIAAFTTAVLVVLSVIAVEISSSLCRAVASSMIRADCPDT